MWSYLYSGVRVERDKLDGAINAYATELTSTYQRGGIKAGAKLSIDLEDFHVWAVTGALATVEPAEFGSAAADHADGAIVHVNAEWSPFEIFRELNNELKSLSSPLAGLFQVETVALTYNAAQAGYDLTGVTNIEGIVSVYAETGVGSAWLPVSSWRVAHDMDTDVFASGHALFTHEGFPGREVRVAYRAPFDPLTASTHDVAAVTGLPASAHDILAMGAALRCAAPAEIDRNQMGSQGSGRRSSEVPAGARLNAVRGLAGLRQERIGQERARLERRYPVRLPRRF